MNFLEIENVNKEVEFKWDSDMDRIDEDIWAIKYHLDNEVISVRIGELYLLDIKEKRNQFKENRFNSIKKVKIDSIKDNCYCVYKYKDYYYVKRVEEEIIVSSKEELIRIYRKLIQKPLMRYLHK